MSGQPVKKILVSARGISTLQVEVKFLHIRTKIPINRKGVTALTVFLLSFLVGLRCKPVFYSGCRSPPANLDYSKKFRLEVKEMSFNYGREEKKWRLWKQAEEKELRDLGVDEETIEKLHTYDWAVFNSDRRYIGRLDKKHIRGVNHALAVSIGLISPVPNRLQLCLCSTCADNFYSTGAYILQRIDKGQTEKDVCTYCTQRMGFDYEVIPKTDGRE